MYLGIFLQAVPCFFSIPRSPGPNFLLKASVPVGLSLPEWVPWYLLVYACASELAPECTCLSVLLRSSVVLSSLSAPLLRWVYMYRATRVHSCISFDLAREMLRAIWRPGSARWGANSPVHRSPPVLHLAGPKRVGCAMLDVASQRMPCTVHVPLTAQVALAHCLPCLPLVCPVAALTKWKHNPPVQTLGLSSFLLAAADSCVTLWVHTTYIVYPYKLVDTAGRTSADPSLTPAAAGPDPTSRWPSVSSCSWPPMP
ncbi:hypothetical protein F4777DRAFT_205539 [Nemania sp. FL0916]|nr:hypothetical protein F4777DRAFT_205539 [Nemania sp. FL0916]